MTERYQVGGIDFSQIKRNPIEWPTIALAICSWGLFGLSTTAFFLTPLIFSPLWVLLNIFALYLNFTIVHDASHTAILRKKSALNHAMGYFATFLWHGSFYQFVLIHHQHHAHANKDGLDPDLHCRGKLNLVQLLKIALTIFYYLELYNRRKLGHMKRHALGAYLPYILLGTIYGLAWAAGFLPQLIVIWGIPAITAIMLSVLVFDYIPHYPHNDPGRFTNARNFIGNPIWTWLTMNHAYHLIHHLQPSIPWYRYEEAFLKQKEALLRAGVPYHKIDFKSLKLEAQQQIENLRSRFGV